MIYLPRCAAQVAGLAAVSQSRFAMTAVRVRELADGSFRIDATDGRSLGIIRGPSDPSPQGLEAARLLPEVESVAAEALVPAKDLSSCSAARRSSPARRWMTGSPTWMRCCPSGRPSSP